MRILLLVTVVVLLAACSIIEKSKVESAVLKALAGDPRTQAYQFEVSCDEQGAVTITGEVQEPETVDIVTEIAKAVPGVTRVFNRCTAPEPGSNMMQDMTVGTPF